jgi:hypothetical protein
MADGTIREVSDSIRGTTQACEELNISIYDLIATKVADDNTKILYDQCSGYCKEKYYIAQCDWSPEAIAAAKKWKCSCYELECEYDDEDECVQMYTFKECSNCGAPLQCYPISSIPEHYSYMESHDNEKYYCIGTTTTAYCSSCGANAREY